MSQNSQQQSIILTRLPLFQACKLPKRLQSGRDSPSSSSNQTEDDELNALPDISACPPKPVPSGVASSIEAPGLVIRSPSGRAMNEVATISGLATDHMVPSHGRPAPPLRLDTSFEEEHEENKDDVAELYHKDGKSAGMLFDEMLATREDGVPQPTWLENKLSEVQAKEDEEFMPVKRKLRDELKQIRKMVS
ncbi:unnamed protein product [Protopolystoma xenopodis]|uniref:Uncharacterized protein n=1 Tax=Protopolystoma xenopodis TaxID=117903 RepID=A0A3S4ZW43_9PLAT|nr:unnamed protein product [Protopolystoma xenopodis]